MKPSHFARALCVASATIATSAFSPVLAQSPAAAPASAASAPLFAVRSEVGKALNEAVDLFRAGKVAEARDRVEKAQAAVADPQAAERSVMHRLRGLFAMQLGRMPEAAQQLEAAIGAGAQSPQDQLLCLESLARVQFNLKAYPTAVDWARKAQAAGSKSAPVQAVLVRATYLQNDYKGTIQLLEAQDKSSPLTMEDLRILASSYGQTKDDANYVRLAERLLRDHGRTEYWADLLSRVQRQPGWQARWDVDLFRLRFALDQMDEAEDYLVLAEMTARAGLPAEAQKVLDAGYTKGTLGKGPAAAEHQKVRSAVTRQASDDRQSLAGVAARPAAASDARSAASTFNTGAALVAAGQAERGLEWMKAALAGPLADPAQARLQYGQSLHLAGRTAEAAEQFKSLAAHESLGLLARLWAAAVATRRN